ncbi:MAG: beta-phosphoglucomutase family hydrolase [Spirochaetia bacterium]
MPLEIDPRARALIFDVDGTLADTMHHHFEAWREVIRRYGVELTEELLVELAGQPSPAVARVIAERYGLELDPQRIAAEKEDAYIHHVDSIEPIEPVAVLAREAHGHLPMGLATGERRAIAERVVRATGLTELFETFVTADDVTHHKPHPETFLRCAELLGVEPAYCQVFEDSVSGMEAGRSAGMIVTDVTVHV